MTLEFLKKFCLEKLESVEIRNNEIVARCPLCGDSKKSKKKKRFHITYFDSHKIIYHCFNCFASGNFPKLYAKINNLDLHAAIKELNSYDTVKSRLSKLDVQITVSELKTTGIDFNDILNDCYTEETEPDSILIESAVKILKDFRESRRIPEEQKLFFAHKGKYAKRIIIPIYNEDNDIVYFQARAISDNIVPKYLNPTAEKNFIPNLHKLESPVIITEGYIDSLVLNNHGTSCLGAEINEEFIDKLKAFKTIIVALDNDSAGYRSLRKILKSKFAYKLKFFLMPKKYKFIKDLNEFYCKQNNINIFKFVIDNTYDKFRTEIILLWESWRS